MEGKRPNIRQDDLQLGKMKKTDLKQKRAICRKGEEQTWARRWLDEDPARARDLR